MLTIILDLPFGFPINNIISLYDVDELIEGVAEGHQAARAALCTIFMPLDKLFFHRQLSLPKVRASSCENRRDDSAGEQSYCPTSASTAKEFWIEASLQIRVKMTLASRSAGLYL